jgi:hypothetical protein
MRDSYSIPARLTGWALLMAVLTLSFFPDAALAKDQAGSSFELSLNAEVVNSVDVVTPRAYRIYCHSETLPPACSGRLQPGTEK